MLGLNRDNLGRFAKSTFTKKLTKYSVLIGIIYLLIHLFNNQYMIVHTRGVYGIVAKATYNAQIEDHAKATMYDSIPTSYLMQ